MKRRGFALAEMLAVVIALSSLLAVSVALIMVTLRAYRADSLVSQRIMSQNMLAEQFQEDVAAAVLAPPKADTFVGGESCLILRRPDDTLVVYVASPGRLERIETSPARKKVVLVDKPNAEVRFSRGGPGDRLITVRYTELTDDDGTEIRGRASQISAALGGDAR
jgi:hypothetical protein